jgi:uncharacterized membrane protein
MLDFIQKYFIEPTVLQSGYNPINTTVYSVIFVLCLYAAIKFFEKSKIKLDKKAWFDLLPFVFLGGIWRTLFDLGFFNFLGIAKFLFITPLIYFSVFLTIVVCASINRIYPKFLKYSGLALAAFFGLIALTFGKDLHLFLTALFFSAFVFTALLAILRGLKLNKIAKSINSHVIFGHVLDACSATVAVTLASFKEAQILSSTAILASPLLFIFLKALAPILLLYYIDKKTRGNTNFILKFALLVLGLPQGIHNSLLLLTV